MAARATTILTNTDAILTPLSKKPQKNSIKTPENQNIKKKILHSGNRSQDSYVKTKFCLEPQKVALREKSLAVKQ